MRWSVITLAMILATLVLTPYITAGTTPPRPTSWNGISLQRDQAIAVQVIRKVFGRYADQALVVSWCEARFWVWARNGQYLGLFQMGSWERATFGHSYNNAWIQARAAYRYFVASGRDWSPWSATRNGC